MPAPTTTQSSSPNPAASAAAVTPSDSTNFASVAQALYIGVGGNAAVVMPDGDVVTFQNLQAGAILPVRCRRVNATNTTASGIVALF